MKATAEALKKNGGTVKDSAPAGGVVKKKKYKPGVAALREIRKYQKSEHENVCRKAPFRRLVRERGKLAWEKWVGEGKKAARFDKGALAAVQDIAEAYVGVMLEDAQLCALHGKRVTVTMADWALVIRMRHETHVGAARVKDGKTYKY